ncbi:MAG: V-type ATPase subunit [Oscillospiraceae bacterium]|jgi:vacuolar-type H+-ATPase subunit C/Vma6|nr:V-type ATPase subunit [Oscillospiraceae bacterium]
MTADLTRYGAVTAKVRAMYGKRLQAGDYTKMAAMKSVSEVADFLRGHPGWGDALATVDTASLRRERLENILRRRYLANVLRLFLYMRREDRVVIRYPVLAVEMDQLMRIMRMASAGQAAEYIFDQPEIVKTLSRVRYDLFPAITVYDDLLEAVKNTDYHAALKRIRPENGSFPSYLAVETQMRRGYFRSLAGLLRGRTGKSGELLREAVGIQADWINIAMIDRILRYYPALMPDIFHYLLPAGAHLKPLELKTMIALDNAEGLRGLLARTFYRKDAAAHPNDSLEKLGQICLMNFFRQQMTGGAPSVFMPIAYVNLFQNELQNLIHTIESVRYGLPAETAERYLVIL